MHDGFRGGNHRACNSSLVTFTRIGFETMKASKGNDENGPIFTIKPVVAAQHAPPSKVTFEGVLAGNPHLQHTSVPCAHHDHPLVKDRFFYTIPKQLLQSTCRPQVGESFE